MSIADFRAELKLLEGKTIESVTANECWNDRDVVSVTLVCTDGTTVELEARGSDEGGWMTIDARS